MPTDPDPRATLELLQQLTPGYEVAAEWRDKCKAAESDRDAGWQAADALAESIDSIQWNCGCCEDVAECANCKRCELARAAYTAARAKRTT